MVVMPLSLRTTKAGVCKTIGEALTIWSVDDNLSTYSADPGKKHPLSSSARNGSEFDLSHYTQQ